MGGESQCQTWVRNFTVCTMGGESQCQTWVREMTCCIEYYYSVMLYNLSFALNLVAKYPSTLGSYYFPCYKSQYHCFKQNYFVHAYFSCETEVSVMKNFPPQIRKFHYCVEKSLRALVLNPTQKVHVGRFSQDILRPWLKDQPKPGEIAEGDILDANVISQLGGNFNLPSCIMRYLYILLILQSFANQLPIIISVYSLFINDIR
jgi:hypothetical protein